MDVTFFETPAALRRWLRAHHAAAAELYVGFHTKASGLGGLTYPEALDEALCWGWIDGIRRKVDADSYTNRFTPRRPGSTWSLVNVRHVARLTAAGRMRPPGLAAFQARRPERTGLYAFEQRPQAPPAWLERALRVEAAAWAFWSAQPPGYRRTAAHWVASARREETRARRLETLRADSAAGRRIALLARPERPEAPRAGSRGAKGPVSAPAGTRRTSRGRSRSAG